MCAGHARSARGGISVWKPTVTANGACSTSTQVQTAQSRRWISLVDEANDSGRRWGSLRCAGQDERASRPRCELACRPHDNRRRLEAYGQPYQLRSRACPECEDNRAVIVRRRLATVGTLHPSAVRAIARSGRSQIRDDPDIDGLAVLRALHVANPDLVPGCRKLRDPHERNEGSAEQSDSHVSLAGHGRQGLVRVRSHSAANFEPCIGHWPGKCCGRARLTTNNNPCHSPVIEMGPRLLGAARTFPGPPLPIRTTQLACLCRSFLSPANHRLALRWQPVSRLATSSSLTDWPSRNETSMPKETR